MPCLAMSLRANPLPSIPVHSRPLRCSPFQYTPIHEYKTGINNLAMPLLSPPVNASPGRCSPFHAFTLHFVPCRSSPILSFPLKKHSPTQPIKLQTVPGIDNIMIHSPLRNDRSGAASRQVQFEHPQFRVSVQGRAGSRVPH